MYTGTLINDLMRTADRVGQVADERKVEAELHEIFTMQIAMTGSEKIFKGAA